MCFSPHQKPCGGQSRSCPELREDITELGSLFCPPSSPLYPPPPRLGHQKSRLQTGSSTTNRTVAFISVQKPSLWGSLTSCKGAEGKGERDCGYRVRPVILSWGCVLPPAPPTPHEHLVISRDIWACHNCGIPLASTG